ncbi:MAG: GAF domain-containing sensor histidine kinase [Anaerolineae bacterium]|nr:GAF domain-containing sensor histidine kinase [Anaerolineae bacterium]
METPEIILVSLCLFVFGALQVITILRWRLVDTIFVHLGVCVSLGFFANMCMLLDLLGVTTKALNYELSIQLSLLGMILTFGGLTLTLLKKNRNDLFIYWGVALAVLLVWSALAFNFQGWTNVAATVISTSNLGLESVKQLMMFVAGFGWIIAIASSLVNLSAEFKKRHSMQFLNRLRYWLIVTFLLGAAGVGLLVDIAPGFKWLGLPLLTGGLALATYNILSYQTPDLKLLFNWGLHYIGIIFVLSSITLVGLVGATQLYRFISNPAHLLIWMAILAVGMGAMYRPLQRLSNVLLMRMIFGRADRDEKQMIRRYNQNVRNTLDVQRLSDVTMRSMVETLDVERGIVFINERTGRGPISLKPFSTVGLEDFVPRCLTIENPLVSYLRQEKKILSQYELDERPEFRSMNADEKQWLADFELELYVPVFRGPELLGVLAVGPQKNGTAYSNSEKDLLVMLAEQASIAMDGALLFQQLSLINEEVGLLNDRMSMIDKSKSEFLSIASHELKTPLTQIHTYSQLLLDLTEDDLRDESYTKKVFEGIARGSERMRDVIDLMLDVSAADLGSMHLFTGPVALKEVFDQAIKSYLPVLDQRRLALREDSLVDLPSIEADGTRLVQLMENLIGNAVKYTPDGGQITVAGRPTTMGDGEPAIEISIADNGIGIDPRYHETIFEKFFRVEDSKNHSTSKTKFKGAGPGLGLTLVKAIVQNHNGEIWVESIGRDEVNRPGSTFYVVLPLLPNLPERIELPQSKIITQSITYS